MANLILFATLTSLLILILFSGLTVRFKLYGEATVEIEFILFKFILYPSRQSTKKNLRPKKAFITRLKRSFTRARAAKAALEYLFSHSALILHDIKFPIKEDEPSKFVLKSESILLFISLILTYLYVKTETLTSEESALITDSGTSVFDSASVDLSLKTSLFRAVIAAIVYKMYDVKLKGRWRFSFVRNKNW